MNSKKMDSNRKESAVTVGHNTDRTLTMKHHCASQNSSKERTWGGQGVPVCLCASTALSP